MPKSIRDIVALSLAVATVLCAMELQPTKEDRLRQELERIRRVDGPLTSAVVTLVTPN